MNVDDRGGRTDSWAARAAANPLTWLLIIGVMFTYPVVRSIYAAQNMPERRPVLRDVPRFSLIDQNGDEVSTDTLQGRAWVVSFTSTRCGATCEPIIETMSSIQHRVRGLGDYIRLLTVTVDPSVDTPERFAEFASRHRASRRIWRFVSGEPAQVKGLMQGLKLAQVPQSQVFLVDGASKLRGFYDMNDPAAIDQLLRDAALLINRGD